MHTSFCENCYALSLPLQAVDPFSAHSARWSPQRKPGAPSDHADDNGLLLSALKPIHSGNLQRRSQLLRPQLLQKCNLQGGKRRAVKNTAVHTDRRNQQLCTQTGGPGILLCMGLSLKDILPSSTATQTAITSVEKQVDYSAR